jgi:hypothetical protein
MGTLPEREPEAKEPDNEPVTARWWARQNWNL